MRRRSTIFLTLAIITLSCNKSEVITPPPLESEVFEANQLTMWADRQNVVINVPITVSQKCKPLYSGKGYIDLGLLGGGRTVLVDSPIVDTLGQNNHHRVIHHVGFTANQDFFHDWIIRLIDPPNIDYGFEATVRMDSILINGTFYHINSEEAKQIAPKGNTFRSFASTVDILVFYHQ